VNPVDRTPFNTFIGVDLGGGKGKNTAVAVLRRQADGVVVEQYDTGGGHPWFDDRLIPFLRDQAGDAVVAIDAPLSLTACVRCREPVCPGLRECVDPTVVWFRQHEVRRQLGSSNGHAHGPSNGHGSGHGNGHGLTPGTNGHGNGNGANGNGANGNGLNGNGLNGNGLNGNGTNGKKPTYTPYTQRLTEVLLHEEHGILPRETLGQGMGPLTARAAHLTRALAPLYRLNHNLIEVYPKATIWKLLGEQTARTYKRHHAQAAVRLAKILRELPGLTFGPGQWRERGVHNDHMFDAVICAYTAFLWARDNWQLPEEGREVFAVDGWIWMPPEGGMGPG
jgi:predicted nuclease with RNAse H fold